MNDPGSRDTEQDLVWMTSEEEEKRIRQDERKKVYDELGVLHGEAARVFNEYLNDPEIHSTPESRELIARARELAKKISSNPEHDEKVKQAAIMECRSLVFNRVTKGECPFGGDCGRCFLCDNAGGCIVITEEARRTDVKAAINEERAKALKKLTRIQFMVKHAWEGDRDTNPPDLGDILKFVEGFIAELRQQSGEQQREKS